MRTYTVVIVDARGSRTYTVQAATGPEALKSAFYLSNSNDDYSVSSVTLTRL